MAGTRTLARVLGAADQAGAKVVLVGDPKQLCEIDAGGVLRGLTARLGAVELVENRRQHEQWERDALEQLRDGDLDVAWDAYERNGRIVTATNAMDVRQIMVSDWWSHCIAGDGAVMMAVRRSDVDDLNGRARAYLVTTGAVSGPELVVDDRPFRAGDDIVCLRNDRRLGVCNGTRATVDAVDVDEGTLTITVDDHRVRLPASYLEAGHIAHGYATTIHKAQGATFDRGLLLGTDEVWRERGYVAMSRGRASNHLYLVGATERDDSTGHGPPEAVADPVDAVRQAMSVTTDKRLAIDTGDALATWPDDALVVERALQMVDEGVVVVPHERDQRHQEPSDHHRCGRDEAGPGPQEVVMVPHGLHGRAAVPGMVGRRIMAPRWPRESLRCARQTGCRRSRRTGGRLPR